MSIIGALVVNGVWLLSFWKHQGQMGQLNVQAAEGNWTSAFTLPSGTGDAVALESYLGHQQVVLVQPG